MKIRNYRKGLAVGLLIVAGSSLLDHYYHLNDFLNGCLKGFGLGIMLLSLYKMKQVPAKKDA